MPGEPEMESEVFDGLTADDVAVFTAIDAARPALAVARLTRENCPVRLLAEARATARRAEIRYRLADLPLAGAAMLVHSPHRSDRRRLAAYLGDRLRDGRFGFLPDGGLTADELALLRAAPGPAGEVGELGRWTALGLYAAIERLVAERLAKPVSGSSVIVQGLGTVGMALCELLEAAGAVLIVADPRRDRVRQATLLFNAIPIAPERAASAVADVLAPCTPEAAIGTEAAATLNARVIAGAVDGLLTDADAADILHDRDIACAPDTVVNAGAAIAAAASRLRLGRDDVERRVRGIADTLGRVMAHAERLRVPPHAAASDLAAARVDRARPDRLPAFA